VGSSPGLLVRAAGPGVHPGRIGGPWLLSSLVPSGLRAVVVPSGLRVSLHPHRCTATKWWNEHYAELLVMPMPGFPALVAGVAVLSGSA
jgi:hypothetical protein